MKVDDKDSGRVKKKRWATFFDGINGEDGRGRGGETEPYKSVRRRRIPPGHVAVLSTGNYTLKGAHEYIGTSFRILQGHTAVLAMTVPGPAFNTTGNITIFDEASQRVSVREIHDAPIELWNGTYTIIGGEFTKVELLLHEEVVVNLWWGLTKADLIKNRPVPPALNPLTDVKMTVFDTTKGSDMHGDGSEDRPYHTITRGLIPEGHVALLNPGVHPIPHVLFNTGKVVAVTLPGTKVELLVSNPNTLGGEHRKRVWYVDERNGNDRNPGSLL
eukprot:TRINITY_DN16121_c0_g1_i1.p1 TRINITY_DN16121_c0_g1~~TRINITY_DN16121_c0_g1_i1.p1  ORF type:complete len:317 (+),score=55.78 TRINITY_DN16121_c0_g1_i1:133-951(+)